ncbi:MAG: helix-turn-helix transcriptional regulator [Candidatus Marinimicrobia bacterium]|nr:helix-turn-helix transcriptional regulator [Candidatus Neomarinimicrobiota bacterium]
MSYNIEFSLATSSQIEATLCKQIEQIRLSRNITQEQLSKDAGVSLRTVTRLEKGEGVSMDTFIRIMIALGIQHNLETLLPDPSIRPVERIKRNSEERKRARPAKLNNKNQSWSWGDGKDNNE